MSPLQIQWNRIRRRWVLILVIALVAGVGALGASLLQGTTYTGRAALTIVSQDRAPEQDTVLAQGYADYFNQPSSQDVLRQTAGVPSSVTLNARIAAASPIVYIEATSRDSDLAADSSTKMAVALRNDVNQGLQGDSQRQITDLQRQLAQAQAANNNEQVNQLQDQINTLQSDTNQLQDLQLNAGVAANSTNAVRNAGAAAVGALLLGILLALALGRFENRIVTPSEVSDRLGLQVLAVVGGRRRSGEDARTQLLRSLMGLTNAYGMPTPGTLAVTGPVSARASKSRVAVALAGLRALQGQTTLLLQTDLDGERMPSELASLPGVADFLAERGGSRIDGKVFANGRALLIGPQGSKRDDLFALFSKSNVQRLLSQGTMLADLVVIDAPPVETVEGQVVCGAADRSVLVVEEGKTRARDASDSLDALGRIGGTALGAVLVRNSGQIHDAGFLKETTWNPVRLPAAPPSGRPAGPPPGPPAGQSTGSETPGAAGQVPPADRTQPISAKKLEEAREALARDPGNAAAAVATAAGASGAPRNGAANRSTNGAPRDGAPAGPGAARDDKPAKPVEQKPGPTGKTDGAPERSQAPERGGAPERSAAPGPRTPGPAAPQDRAVPPRPGDKGPTNGAPKPGVPAPGAGAGTSSGATGGGASSGGAPGSPGPSSGPDATEGPGARVTRRPGGSDAKPSPRPKPADPPPAARSVTPSTPGKPGTPATTPGSPQGAKRVGTARFSSGTSVGSSAAAGKPAAGKPGENASGDNGAPKDGLAAPTVTLRTEK